VKVGAILVTHDLKAARDGLDNWRLGILVLTQAGHACFAADRTPESLVPSDGYSQGRGPASGCKKPLGDDNHEPDPTEHGDGDCSEVNQPEKADTHLQQLADTGKGPMAIEVQSEIQGPVSFSKCRWNRHTKTASAEQMIGRARSQRT
jgi:hypothetical protein